MTSQKGVCLFSAKAHALIGGICLEVWEDKDMKPWNVRCPCLLHAMTPAPAQHTSNHHLKKCTTSLPGIEASAHMAD